MDRKMIAMTASMDGQRAVAERTGKKIKISECEAVALCNLAEIGMYCVLAFRDDAKPESTAALQEQIDTVRTQLANDSVDGVTLLMNVGAAILRGEKLWRFVVEEPE